jgi:hypothetical protein
MKYTLTLLLMVAMAFSSCKKDEKEDIKKKEEPKTLAQTIVGTWKMTEFSVDVNLTIMGFPAKVEQRYSNMNVAQIFNANNTFTNSGSADYTTKVLLAGQVVEEDSGNEEFEEEGTYNVISDTKMTMSFQDEIIEFNVISFSDTKIELSGEGSIEDEDTGETIIFKIKQTFTK